VYTDRAVYNRRDRLPDANTIDRMNERTKPRRGNMVQEYRKTVYGRRSRDRMVVEFITICEISAYHHWSCGFESCSWRDVLDTTLCDKAS
jgi:hypothetical protein